MTGGAFIFTDAFPDGLMRDYSAFVASLDSEGNGLLQTTTLMWPGDANNNQNYSFVDDALYTMVALGDTGPKRDTLDAQYHLPLFSLIMECGQWSVIMVLIGQTLKIVTGVSITNMLILMVTALLIPTMLLSYRSWSLILLWYAILEDEQFLQSC